MKKYRVTVELITVITVKCENREEAKRLATAEASLLPNVVSRQILSVGSNVFLNQTLLNMQSGFHRVQTDYSICSRRKQAMEMTAPATRR